MTLRYVAGFDPEALIREAQAIRDELGVQIPGVATLVEPPPAEMTAPKLPGPTGPIEEYNKQELGNEQELPMTKAVVSGKALEESSQEGYAEAVKNVAGVAPANSKGSPNDSIYIRGIKLNLFSNYRLNGGLPTAGVITTPNQDKERIETLKGANALMFGVPSPAGISLLPAVNGVVPITPVPNPRNLLSGTWAMYAPKTVNVQSRVDFIIADGWRVLAEAGRSDSERSRFTVRIGGYNPVTGAGGN